MTCSLSRTARRSSDAASRVRPSAAHSAALRSRAAHPSMPSAGCASSGACNEKKEQSQTGVGGGHGCHRDGSNRGIAVALASATA
eukprot:352030-Chlamydomonas_euryale.AAC.2